MVYEQLFDEILLGGAKVCSTPPVIEVVGCGQNHLARYDCDVAGGCNRPLLDIQAIDESGAIDLYKPRVPSALIENARDSFIRNTDVAWYARVQYSSDALLQSSAARYSSDRRERSHRS